MDPLIITGAILRVTAQCLSTAKTLDTLRDRYRHASVIIAAICSEATLVSASLAQVQNLVLRDRGGALSPAAPYKPELQPTFEAALTGLGVTFAVLDDEVRKLLKGCADEPDGGPGWKAKARFLWKEDTMSELLQQLRGQQTALSLLIQALQMDSLSDLHTLLESHTALLTRLVERTVTLRKSHPRAAARAAASPSVFTPAAPNLATLRSTSPSRPGSAVTAFAFDEHLLATSVYRRVLHPRGRSPPPRATNSDRPPSPALAPVKEVAQSLSGEQVESLLHDYRELRERFKRVRAVYLAASSELRALRRERKRLGGGRGAGDVNASATQVATGSAHVGGGEGDVPPAAVDLTLRSDASDSVSRWGERDEANDRVLAESEVDVEEKHSPPRYYVMPCGGGLLDT